MDYTRGNHSKHCLMCHLIFVCKYSKHLLIQFGEQIKQFFIDIAKENHIIILEMEIDKNHIHLLVEYKQKQSILEIVRLFKQIYTYRIWRQNENHIYLKKIFWKERTFCSDGYFACSIGMVSKDIIEKYIQQQG